MSAPEYKFEKLTDTIYVCASSESSASLNVSAQL